MAQARCRTRCVEQRILAVHTLRDTGAIASQHAALTVSCNPPTAVPGHMVPQTNPREALDMFSRFLDGKHLAAGRVQG